MVTQPRKLPAEVITFPREEFIEERFDYETGEHVTLLGPTQSGKSTLAGQLIDHVATEEVPAVILVMKPRDKTVTKWIKQYEWKKVETWPPVRFFWQKKPEGYVLWPKHTFNTDRDNDKLSDEFGRALMDSYKKGDRIVFGDEIYGLVAELGLKDDLITIYSRGSSMGCGLWAATQKPTHVPLWAYSQANHLFIANDPDERARERFGEIGGIDPKFVEYHVMRLPKYHWLYICRNGPTACIVGP